MKNKLLMDYIGEPATLEQLAEECSELSFAALKLARMLRGENKVHGRTVEELTDSLAEEAADVMLCVDELSRGGTINDDSLIRWYEMKQVRMQERLSAEGKENKNEVQQSYVHIKEKITTYLTDGGVEIKCKFDKANLPDWVKVAEKGGESMNA